MDFLFLDKTTVLFKLNLEIQLWLRILSLNAQNK